jgi:transcription initiation factor TFIIIB Brf1 subunit/transcription initiation factor TFIIB
VATKLTTCSYCGNQELIRLAEGERFQLVCAACGARSKQVDVLPDAQRARSSRPEIKPAEEVPPRKTRDFSKDERRRGSKKSRRKEKEKKKKKSFKYWVKKAIDEIEDIFD